MLNIAVKQKKNCIKTAIKVLLKKKRIQQLNLDGSFVKEWDSATQVEKELGFNRKAIVQCLIKKSKKKVIIIYGCMYRF